MVKLINKKQENIEEKDENTEEGRKEDKTKRKHEDKQRKSDIQYDSNNDTNIKENESIQKNGKGTNITIKLVKESKSSSSNPPPLKQQNNNINKSDISNHKSISHRIMSNYQSTNL